MSVVTYLDFYIEVTEQYAPSYQIVVRSKAGEARASVTFPYTSAQLEMELQRLENAILYAHISTRRRLTPNEAAVRDLGVRFFEFLLPSEIRSLYYECQRLAEFEGKGVRINLLIHPPYLASLPWEFLHDPRSRDYIALDSSTPLVRYPELAKSVSPLPVTPPLRILGLVANPADLDWIDVESEQQQMKAALQPLLDRRLIELTWLPGQKWRDLQQWMRPGYGPWHIFHFIGHGEFDPQRDEGRIFLTDDEGKSQGISATQLSRLLRPQRRTLRLAILNACEGARGGKFDVFSSTAATLVLGGLPAVLAMQYTITDAAALEFARTFYSAIADNLPVDAAVADARNSINLRNEYSLEWGTPVLFMRTADGKLFSAGVYRESQQDGNSDERAGQSLTKAKTTEEQVEITSKSNSKNSEDIQVQSNGELKPLVAVEQSLEEAVFQRFDKYWKNLFLPTVRRQYGVRIEAALRIVRDIAVFQDRVIFAFGSNEFARDMIADPETNNKLVALLSKFLERSIRLDCQLGERIPQDILNDINLLVHYSITKIEMKGQNETSNDLNDKWKLTNSEVVMAEQPLSEASVQKFIASWREQFLPTVRKEYGVRVEAALRGVRDIAISHDCVAFAFGSNDFTRELITETEINGKLAALLSKILGRSVRLECQQGERAYLIDPLVQYAVSALGAKVVKQTTM